LLKIDFSTIALILSLVVPGLVAKKSRRKISPQSFESTGPATELGTLVALSLSVHLTLLALFAVGALTSGLLSKGSAFFYLRIADQFDYPSWDNAHRFEIVLILASYLCLSVMTGYVLGILNGWLELNHPLSRLVESSPFLTTHLKRLGIFALLEERPLSFELFSGEAVNRKTDLIYFLEIQLRGDKGFVTGDW
jgi:hypothetical protein